MTEDNRVDASILQLGSATLADERRTINWRAPDITSVRTVRVPRCVLCCHLICTVDRSLHKGDMDGSRGNDDINCRRRRGFVQSLDERANRLTSPILQRNKGRAQCKTFGNVPSSNCRPQKDDEHRTLLQRTYCSEISKNVQWNFVRAFFSANSSRCNGTVFLTYFQSLTTESSLFAAVCGNMDNIVDACAYGDAQFFRDRKRDIEHTFGADVIPLHIGT